MSIKIPSKHIYEIQNPKIRDNVYDNVAIVVKEISPNNEYEVALLNEAISVEFSSDEIETKNETKYGYDQDGDDTGVDRYYTCSKIDNMVKYKKGSLTIPISQPNKYISKLQKRITTQDGSEKDEPIQYSIRGNKSYATTSATWNYDGSSYDNEITNTSKGDVKVEKAIVLDIPQQAIIVEEKNSGASSIVSSIQHPTIIKVTKNVANDCYIIEYDILCFLEYSTYKGKYTTAGKYETGFSTSLSGEYVKYEPTDLELTIYGNTIGISLEDKNILYGSGTKPFSYEGNELIQKDGKYLGSELSEILARNVLTDYGSDKYKSGKETAEIVCGIADYYDENGEKVISIDEVGNPMLFSIHDEVIPYVYSVGGVDKPMSLLEDGSPKKFIVVGVEPYYDGAVFQKIYLLQT